MATLNATGVRLGGVGWEGFGYCRYPLSSLFGILGVDDADEVAQMMSALYGRQRCFRFTIKWSGILHLEERVVVVS